ncbi:MAG: mechanosensitive ion channel [Alphaproteobacteria bacterium]|nr:mechanosensitive ion channel [Alphaproteobacteria bacterium]
MQSSFENISQFVLMEIGGARVTVASVAAAILVLIVAFALAALAGGALRRLRGRTRHGQGTLFLMEKFVSYGVVAIGFVVALSTVGLDLSALAVFAGALGIGIGLGLQGIVKEFFSGLVLVLDRLVGVGDYVELSDGRRGVVEEIGPRAARIRNNDNIDILIPNSALIENTVVNWTFRNAVRRIHIPFSVAYGADKSRVREAVLEAAHSVPFTLPDEGDRRAQVWMVGFGDSALEFELLVWPSLEACKRPAAMQAAYTWAIDDALRAAGIEVPFPQRDVRVRSFFGREDAAALAALGLDERRSEATQHRPPLRAASVNDAADELEREDRAEPAPEEGP